MRFLRPKTFLVFALAALSGVVLMHTSQSVQRAEDKYRRLQASVEHEQERLHLLKAEWESLNRPERLERLAEEFLDILPPSSDAIVGEVGVLPQSPEMADEEMLRDEAPQTVLQPVSYEAAEEAVPVPPKKPSAPTLPPQKEKTFDEMMRGLGGAP